MVCTIAVSAKPVDSLRMHATAENFFRYTLGTKGSILLNDRSSEWHYTHLRLYTRQQGGWVLMSDNDIARPIIAYSTTGTFDPANPPAALTPMLQQYDNEIAAAINETLVANLDWNTIASHGPLSLYTKDGEADSVGPLLQTQWFQLSPYNQYCPSGCPTGCVATAAAQVMKYWNYPAFGKGSHSYTSDAGYGVLSADFAHTVYDWENMPERLTSASPAEQCNAVATLMYHIGVSVQMGYNPMQSGAFCGNHDGDSNAYCSQNSLWRFFRYNRQDISYHEKGSMSNEQWTNMLIAELQQLRPVLYNGRGGAGGHAFVCDGYDSRHYLHFNLGEAGDGDGFYAVGAISYGMYNFNMENNCVMGIHPDYGIYLSDETLTYDRNGGSRPLWLATCDTSDAPWTASCSASWLHLTDTAFQHLGQLHVVCDENNTGDERSATITFTQGQRSATLTVTQDAWDESNYCPLTVVMECTRTGSAWANDAHLSFESPSGHIYGTAALTSTTGSATTTVNVPPSTLIVKYHRGGPQDRYYNYWILNAHGDTLVAVQNAYYNGGETTVENPCGNLDIDPFDDRTPLLVYPNPTNGLVNIESPQEGMSTYHIMVLDATGRTILSSQNAKQIDLSSFPAGIYYIRLLSTDGTIFHKTVVLKKH